MENNLDYFRFDQSQLTQLEKSCILAIINNASEYEITHEAENMLYGLFDGYGYKKLPTLIGDSKMGQDGRWNAHLWFSFVTVYNRAMQIHENA